MVRFLLVETPVSPAATGAHEMDELCRSIDGVAVSDLVAKHGSPLFVFSEATLRRTCREAFDAFSSRYPDVQFAWSYKTNYLRAICQIIHQEGAIAEVVSDFEYDKARAGGIAPADIIFNGAFKPAPMLERAVVEGAKIQIDNWDELELLGAIAKRRGRVVNVGVRVFVDAGVRPLWTKFGFDANEAVRAVERIQQSRYVRFSGLHTHLGTFILDPQAYVRAAGKLIELAKALQRRFGCEIEYLNLGGGFPSFGREVPADVEVLPMDVYAAAISSMILDLWPPGAKRPRLYLESGRALVDAAGWLITTILARKQRSPAGSARDYVVDAGVNLLPTATEYPYRVLPERRASGAAKTRTLFGCLCMNTDVLRERVELPDLNVGDRLVLHPVGAYNVTQSMQFIAYRPRIVMVMVDGRVEVIRERENLEYVEGLERWTKA
jgi:diaminopimelate decarboxylase